MCGICGVVGFREPERAAAAVRRMMANMVHRGPDDEGIFVDRAVALGMRRLSIIDLEGGHQPLFNEDHTLAVVFNGEIYNFQELRRALQSRGHTFRTCSDTEVIIHGYEEWGADCVNHLEGMFAFALAETSKSCRDGSPRVLLARDRLGIKPLYYAVAGGTLFFASEVRSLLAAGEIPRQLSLPALWNYLLFGSLSEPMTLVEGVFSLPPGHHLWISAGGAISEAQPLGYWTYAQPVRLNPRPATRPQDSITLVREMLEDTIERHLIADVPVGVFLSGGIDSTSLAALATKVARTSRASHPVRTLTVAFPEEEFSEAQLARRTAERLGTQHQELLLTGEEMVNRLDEAIRALDQPSMDGINAYFVSWAARQSGLKVALSGLGADEIFGGYPTFHSTPRARWLAQVARLARGARLAGDRRWLPSALRSAAASAATLMAGRRGQKDAARKLLAMWRDPDALPHPYFYTRLLFTPTQAAEIMPGAEGIHANPARDWLIETAREASQLDSFSAVSCLEARSYMVNTLLRDTDAMSMANSLEVRVPFLNHPLVEFVARLPESVKRNKATPKSLLTAALKDLLPDEIVYQPKRTFTLPWERWLRGPLRRRVAAGIVDTPPSLRGVLDHDAIRRVWRDFLDCRTSWSRVWSLFVLNEWVRHYLPD